MTGPDEGSSTDSWGPTTRSRPGAEASPRSDAEASPRSDADASPRPEADASARPDADASAATQAFYDRWARLYDRVATLPPIGSWRERAADALELEPGDTVVEMGCGTGANLPYLRERVGPEGRVIGLDLTRGPLAVARQRIASAGWDNVHCCRADATAPPVATQVDAILATFVVGMLPDPGGTVADWLDCLAPDGRLALMDAAPTDHTLVRPLNLPFGLFVWATAPGEHSLRRRPSRDLERKVRAARRSLEGAGEDVTTREFGLGFLRVTAGSRPPV